MYSVLVHSVFDMISVLHRNYYLGIAYVSLSWSALHMRLDPDFRTHVTSLVYTSCDEHTHIVLKHFA